MAFLPHSYTCVRFCITFPPEVLSLSAQLHFQSAIAEVPLDFDEVADHGFMSELHAVRPRPLSKNDLAFKVEEGDWAGPEGQLGA